MTRNIVTNVVARITHTYCNLYFLICGLQIPQVQSKIDSEVTKTRASFEHSMVKHPENWNINHALPNDGKSDNEIMEIVDSVVDFEKVAARQNAGKVRDQLFFGLALFFEQPTVCAC